MRTLILSAALAILLLAGIGRSTAPNDVEAGTAIRLDVAGLVENADLILEGRVLSALPLRSEVGIETEYLIQVDRTFLGEDYVHRLVRMPGGVLEDGSGMMLAGMPHLRAGEEALLFLSKEGGRGIRMPVGLSQGKMRIAERSDGTRVVITDAAGVALVNPVSGAVSHGEGSTVREYADVVAQIEAALN